VKSSLDNARVLDPSSEWVPCCTEVYEEQNGSPVACSSGLDCCSNVCADGGVCACAATGGYCFVSSDCCSGACDVPEGCCLDDAGECPNDGGNPWLDGQL
jgi:hypothetical protein